MLYPVILAGGSGSRLWPLSRKLYPKQFLPLTGDYTLFQDTVRRLENVPEVAPPIVVCNETHRFLVSEQLDQLGIQPEAIILEPMGRNTAPSLTLAALLLGDRVEDPDPAMLVLPADQVMKKVEVFQEAVQRGHALARQGGIITFGIVPTNPNTGYGYIKRGEALGTEDRSGGGSPSAESPMTPSRVAQFVEKPDLAVARDYVDSGEYLWNSGMFLLRPSVWLTQLEKYRPDIAEACRTTHSRSRRDGCLRQLDPEVFGQCPSESIDYAVMEKVAGRPSSGPKPHAAPAPDPAGADRVECAVLPLDAGWSDVGSWSVLWEEDGQDDQGNVIKGDDVHAHGTRNSLLLAQHRLLATVGLEDVIVVETADAVLVAHKDSAQEVREVVNQLEAESREEVVAHRKVHRPWGCYETVDAGPRFQVKRLTVNPGAALSLQMHFHRAEHWVVVRGTAKVTRGEEEFLLTENQSTYIPVGEVHRLENQGTIPLEVVEVQSGSYLGEDDIVRLEDRYQRPSYEQSRS